MKNKKFIRVAALLLALLSVASCFSCGEQSYDDKSQTTSSDTTVSEEEDELTPNLPDVKYGGEFTILTKIEGYGIYNNEHIYVEE